MKASAVRELQTALAAAGAAGVSVTGRRDAETDAAVAAMLAGRPADLPPEAGGWSAARRAVAALQLVCRDAGFDPGPIDGLWGRQTEFAFASLETLRATGAPPHLFRDVEPIEANPHGWPMEGDADARIIAFYGPPGVPEGREPPLVNVPCPWKLKIDFLPGRFRTHLRAHPKCADSLAQVLERVHETYGAAEIARLGFDVFSGDYNARKKRGGSGMSMHSWGIAFDFDGANNPLRAGRDKASFAHPDCIPWWEIWEREGWVSLGRARNFDWMHVQAAKLRPR